jgi:hypothetical protein
VKKPPLTAEDEEILAKMLANREKRRKEDTLRGPPPPPRTGGTLDKKWQEPFLAGAFPEEPRPPTPVFSVSAAEAVERGLPPISVSVDALRTGLEHATPVCDDALLSLAGTTVGLHVIVGRVEEPLEDALRRWKLIGGDAAQTDTVQARIANVMTTCSCFAWRQAVLPGACCAASIEVGGAPVIVVLECNASAMARPTCAQVLALLGDVAQTLRLQLVGA